MKRIIKTLAIDYGTQRIGLAVSQATLAEPLMVIEYDQEAIAIAKIVEICREYQIKQLLIGLSEQLTADRTKQFAQHLAEAIDLPQIFFDETLSSNEVRRRFQARGKLMGRKIIDHYAAAVFLEEWIALQ
jgi:putative transcription antitermination factor YqgF